MAQASAKIALIICSTRKPRVGLDIASWVFSTISVALSPPATLITVDLDDYPLPISPCTLPIPASQPLPLPDNAYGNEAINAWSKEINQYAGFIFLTPQFNWSFPAAVKCAIDHLYHEWAAKPALIVSYGKRGGPKANAQLRQVLLGVRMSPWEANVQLPTLVGYEDSDRGVLDEEVVREWKALKKKDELLARWEELLEQVDLRAKI